MAVNVLTARVNLPLKSDAVVPLSKVPRLCYAMLCYAMLCYAMLCYASTHKPESIELSAHDENIILLLNFLLQGNV